MGYSMTRAIPMGIIGFVLGAAFVVLLRGLQQMNEVWNTQLGLTMGGLFAAIFFLWGIGALSGKMAAHVIHEPEEDEFGNELPVEEHHHDEPTGAGILQEQVWAVAFWVSVVAIGAFAFAALPGGLGYTISTDAAANANNIGYFTMDLPGGNTVVVSQLLVFVIFVVFTMISLFGAAWLFSKALFGLNSGIKTVKVVGNQPLMPLLGTANSSAGLLASGEGVAEVSHPVTAVKAEATEPKSLLWALISAPFHWLRVALGFIFKMLVDEADSEPKRTTLGRLSKILQLLITAFILYFLFYEALVGWIIKVEPDRTMASLTSAIMIPLLIFRTRWILYIVGLSARFGVWLLRGLPNFLGQK